MAESALTLVSAPAGFVKTTLLTEWMAAAPGDGPSVAWLSLDRRDNDPAVFWSYVVAALRTAAPGVGESALSLLESARPSTEAVLASLLNDLDAVTRDLMLVLDDYHVVESREVQDGMAFLLELLSEAERLYAGDFFPNVRPVPAVRARVWIAHGRLAEALAWMHERGLSVEDDLDYLREFEHMTFARVLLARHTAEPAEHALDEATRLLAASWERRRREPGPEASSTSSCCRRSPTRRAATSLPHSLLWTVR